MSDVKLLALDGGDAMETPGTDLEKVKHLFRRSYEAS